MEIHPNLAYGLHRSKSLVITTITEREWVLSLEDCAGFQQNACFVRHILRYTGARLYYLDPSCYTLGIYRSHICKDCSLAM